MIYLSSSDSSSVIIICDHYINYNVYVMMKWIVFGKASEAAKGFNSKADVWSFGMLLYELMTLDIPYRNTELNSIQLFDYIQEGNPPKVSRSYHLSSHFIYLVISIQFIKIQQYVKYTT